MDRTFYQVYRNGRIMEGCSWSMRRTAIDIMRIEIECEIEELKRTHSDSQFTIDVDEEKGIGTIDEYVYDEKQDKDYWNLDISKYEVREFIR